MDAIQIAIEHSDIDIFCLVASDKGYSNLALRLRELGKYVLGIGEEKKAKEDSLLVNACNEFIYVENLKSVDDKILLDSDSESEIDDNDLTNFSLSKFIAQAYDSTPKTKEGCVLLSRLAESIKSLKSDFDYKNYDFKSFKQMIDSFSDEYEMISDEKTPPSYMILKKEFEDLKKNSEGIIHRLIANYGIIKSENGEDYFFYNGDIKKEYHNIKLKKGLRVRFSIVKEPNENAQSTKERNGRADEIEIFE